MSVTISIRIRKELKEELEKLGINISKAVREYLEELAWRHRVRRELEYIDNVLLKNVKPSSKGFSVESIREDRDESH